MAVMPFATGTNAGSSLAVDTEQLVNLYPEVSKSGKSLIALHARPGLTDFYDYGGLPLRGTLITGDSNTRFTLFAVNGSSLTKRSEGDPFASFLGTLDTSEGDCYLASNGTQVLVTDGQFGYLYDIPGDSFIKLDAPTHGWWFTTPRWCTYLGTYFIALEASTGNYGISGNNDGLSWNAADIGVAETDPDGTAMLVANHGDLFLFGTRTVEIHYVTQGADFPFEPKLSATMQWGTPAPFSVAKFNDTLAFLGQSERGGLRVFALNGYQPVRISTDSLEERLLEYARIDDARAIAYDWAGHAFYVLTFPTEDVSWCYDAFSEQWHVYQSSDPSGARRYIGDRAVGFENVTLISDYRNGKLYRVTRSESDGDVPIYVQATGKVINEGQEWIEHDNFEIVLEHGTSGQNVKPVARLRFSDTFARTWSNEYHRSIGPVGKYSGRARWNRLGRSRDRVYEITITDATPKVIVGMVVNGGP